MATATVFVPDCLRTFSRTQGVSLRNETLLTSSVESSDVAQVADGDRPSVAVVDRDGVHFLHAADAAHRAERVFRRADLHRAAGHLEVLRRKAAATSATVSR